MVLLLPRLLQDTSNACEPRLVGLDLQQTVMRDVGSDSSRARSHLGIEISLPVLGILQPSLKTVQQLPLTADLLVLDVQQSFRLASTAV